MQSKERTLSYISMSCILFHEQVWTDNMQNVEQPVLSSHGDDSLAAGSFKGTDFRGKFMTLSNAFFSLFCFVSI